MVGVAIFEPSESGYEAFLKHAVLGPSRCGVTERFLGRVMQC